ncbi:MAG: heme-binding protein [Lachnospiraceae bacterium]|nr:heme-binding protein [Lachnospiraceae bacterium]
MEEKDIERIVRQCLKELTPVKSVDLETAKLLIEAVEAEAAKVGVKAVVAVSDEKGRPIAVHCMDGSYIGSFDIAINKTYTSVAFQMPTSKLAELAAPGGSLYGIQHTNEGKVVIFGGGEPLYAGDRMVGAIGVSGGSAEQDTYLGQYGKRKFEEIISWK